MLRGAAGAGLIGGMLLAGTAQASAWPVPPGRTFAIVKYEPSAADEGYDPTGARVLLPAPLREDAASLFVERGLTPRLTFQGKLTYQSGEDQFVRYAGRGPVELGLRYALLVRPRSVVSLYVGGVLAGEGRNAGYAAPKQGDGDLEVRLLAGRTGRWRGRDVFAEAQVARLVRSGLPDETRLDLTAGVYFTRRWLVLVQSYAGQADASPVAPRWLKVESSIVRHVGPWSLQVGWREATYGRESPAEHGPVIGLWRRF